jgi:hypothetical protein
MDLKINFQDINWREFITPAFWFELNSYNLQISDKLFALAGALLLVIGFGFLIYSRFAANQFLAGVAKRIAKILITTGILEFIWFGLRYQYVQMLGTRIVALLILVIGIAWLYFPIKYLVTHYKTDMEKAEREASRAKYLNVKK